MCKNKILRIDMKIWFAGENLKLGLLSSLFLSFNRSLQEPIKTCTVILCEIMADSHSTDRYFLHCCLFHVEKKNFFSLPYSSLNPILIYPTVSFFFFTFCLKITSG